MYLLIYCEYLFQCLCYLLLFSCFTILLIIPFLTEFCLYISLLFYPYIYLHHLSIRGLSGKYPAILNISRTGRVALVQLGSQSEKTLLCIHEQSLSRGASHSAVRRHWMTLCTVWPSHSQISSLLTAILALGIARSHREPNRGCRGADRSGWCDVLPKKRLHENCRMGRCIVVMKLICSLGHCECDGHSTQTQSTVSHCRLTSPTGERLFTDAQ